MWQRSRRTHGGSAYIVTVFGCASCALLAGGCPSTDSGGLLGGGDGSSFSSASQLSFSSDGKSEFQARIADAGDVDVFSLGTLAPGDRVVIDVQTRSGDLDAVAALFDPDENIHAFNDDRAADASDLDPLISVTILGKEGEYFLGVAPFPGSETTGDYDVSIRITRGGDAPLPSKQVVFLDWDGGQDVVIENVGVFDIPVFDASRIGPYAGQTEKLKDLVQNYVKERFAGFNAIILNSDDDPVPAEPHSTVYFGTFNRRAFGISEQIDTHNADHSDNSIIFTDSFRDAFSVTPDLETMAVALGNTTAHEIGHLLGLVHTKECADLMDTTCGNDSILVEQAFGLAPLDDSVFPIGFQDSIDLITWTLGLAGV